MEPNGKLPQHYEKLGAHISPTLPSPPPFPQQKQRDAKVAYILDACKWKDIESLRILATSDGGLISDAVRRQAWPLLLGYSRREADDVTLESEDTTSWVHLPKHRDEDQVQLDVDRSFVYYPHDQSSTEMLFRKSELSCLIIEVLRQQPYLCYFQGYHDICQVFLLVLEPHSRVAAVARLSTLRIRDFMLPTLAPALAQLRLIPAILYAVDPKLCAHLSQTQPFFALSGTLTMYAHDIQEYGHIARLFDVFLAREAVFSVYVFAQIVLQRSDELFETPADEPELLHSILSKLPKPLDLESLIAKTVKLIEKHPPESLREWQSISRYSVLKTSHYSNQGASQTIEDGKAYFKKHEKELQWAEQRERLLNTMWNYRRPAGTIGLALLVGVLSFWLRRFSGPSGLLGVIWRHWSGYQGH